MLKFRAIVCSVLTLPSTDCFVNLIFVLGSAFRLTCRSKVRVASKRHLLRGVFNEVLLDRTLAMMAAEVQTPLTVDETTTLVRIEALGRELRCVYEVDADVNFLPLDMRLRLTQQNCSLEALTGVIDAGAILRHFYLRMDGSEIGVAEVTRQACGR